MSPSYIAHLSVTDIALISDAVEYVMHHFEAEDAENGQRFAEACRALLLKANALRVEAGLVPLDLGPATSTTVWPASASTHLH